MDINDLGNVIMSSVKNYIATKYFSQAKTDDTYYDANGNEVSEEAYNQSCTTAENPQTGSFLPYTLIIVGIALAGGLYYITKKNNKMYQV